MGCFSMAWLALREPADHASINAQIRQRLRAYFERQTVIRVVDLGCGTGSNLRSLSPDLPARQAWTMVDFDEQLLEIARQRMATYLPEAKNISADIRAADLSKGDISEFVVDAHLVTAAAFFDLVSTTVIESMVAQIAEAGCVFSTTLTYDGIAAWLPHHKLDEVMRHAFNKHQHSDKGFGIAAGPAASNALTAAFEKHNYTVVRGASPWMLTERFAELRQKADAGWANAVAETNTLSREDIEGWMHFRETHPSAVTIIGHEDLLALPPE